MPRALFGEGEKTVLGYHHVVHQGDSHAGERLLHARCLVDIGRPGQRGTGRVVVDQDHVTALLFNGALQDAGGVHQRALQAAGSNHFLADEEIGLVQEQGPAFLVVQVLEGG